MAERRLLVLVFAAAVLHSLIPSIAADFSGQNRFEWEILTAKNFSSQIRLHPHVLLIVTVPWCGESRSLMRQISHKLEREQHKYNSLKLMVVHRNLDAVLVKSLDAVEGITVLCYHSAVSYRYQGGLRAEDILSSVHYLTSAAAQELPLKRLNNSEDLDIFLASTGMAVLLFESCGWTSRLLMQHYGNGTLQGGVLPGNRETNITLATGRQKNLKGVGTEMLSCEAADGCGFSSWVGEFSAQNETAAPTDEDMQPTFETSCSYEEYKKFESFFLEFMAMARDLYLPPQKQRYGLVSERSLLSHFGVEVSDQWSLIISYAGCPGCLRVIKEESHLRDVFYGHDLPVMELSDRGDFGPSLPVDKPSMLLFIDRASDSAETRRKSQEALQAFKEVALQYWRPNELDNKNIDWLKKSSLHTNMFGHQRLMLSSSSQKIKLNEKMSIMIITEGKQVTLDHEASNLDGKSLQEILTYLVGKKKQLKLSSLAKEAGFQLLSDDMEIKSADSSSSQTESENQDSAENSIEKSDKVLDINNDGTEEISSAENQVEESHSLNVEAPSTDTEQKSACNLVIEESDLLDPHQSANIDEIVSAIDVDSKMQTDLQAEKSENPENQLNVFTGSFLFSECSYQFLRSLTNDPKVPRMVIVDPISEQHYVLPEAANLSSESISTFINGFLNGTLTPYQRSGNLRSSIDTPHPPFVNLDFQERDSIPSVTTSMFSELVFGSDQLNEQNTTTAFHKDVVVLFSSSWCGFCQRMELVVREVYRGLKGYVDMVNADSKSDEKFLREDLKDLAAKIPAIYSIDCTLNECGGILKSVGQGEVYPTLLLFSAERKSPIVYDGNMMVTDVIKFIANHGSSSNHLANQKGTLWIENEDKDNQEDQFKPPFTSEGIKEPLPRNADYSKAGTTITKPENKETLKPSEIPTPKTIAIGSFLTATEQLLGLNLFSESKILIVGANHEIGFQGLIVNKLISWDSIQFEDAKLAQLLKEAPLSFGGPVIQEGLPFVTLVRSSLYEHHPQVLPGVYFLDPVTMINEIEKIKAGNRSAKEYWFFWGYSGWGWDQLFSEIAGGSWTVQQGKLEDLQWP